MKLGGKLDFTIKYSTQKIVLKSNNLQRTFDYETIKIII